MDKKQAPLSLLGIAQRTRKSPFYNATIRAGAKAFTVYNHMLMPLYYDSPEADYWQLLNNVTVWDVAVERQVEISGPDAYQLVRLMTPRNLSKMAIGQCKYIPIVAEDGGMVNDPILLRLAEDRFWLSLADSDVLLYAKGIAFGLGLNVAIHEPDVSPLAIQGPRADDVAAALLGDWVRELRFFWFKQFDLDGISMVVARSGWSKQGGVELYLQDGSQGERLWDKVMAAGRAYQISPAAPSTIERIESGLLSYGNDMTLANNPFEVGLDRYCDVDQAFGFIGKEALQKIKAAGIQQKLMGLFIDGERMAGNEHHWSITVEGVPAGYVTSAAYSPRLQRNIGMGMLPIELIGLGTSVSLQTPFGERTGVVTTLPFV